MVAVAAGGEGVAGGVGAAVEDVPHAGDEPGEAEGPPQVAAAAAEQVGADGHDRDSPRPAAVAARCSSHTNAPTSPSGGGRGPPGRARPRRHRRASRRPGRRGAPMVDQDGPDPVAGLGSELVDQEVGRLGDPVVEGAVRQLDPLVPVVVVPGEQGLVAVAPGLALGGDVEAPED